MSEFVVLGGYDSEGMRGHVAVLPPPKPDEVQRFAALVGNLPLVPMERGDGLELTFKAEQRRMVGIATHDISNELTALGHEVTMLAEPRELRFGEFLLKDA